MQSELAKNWMLVVVCSLGVGIGIASLPFYAQGIFISHWIAEFGWSRTEASLGGFFSTLVLGLASPLVGAYADRNGFKKPLAFSFAGLSLALILFCFFLNSLGSFIILSMLMALLGSATSPLIYTRIINSTFDRQRGLALGLTLSGVGLGGALGPPAVSFLIEQIGWRESYIALAVVTGFVATIVYLGLSRQAMSKKIDFEKARQTDRNANFGDVIKSGPFWHLMFAVLLLSLGITGLIIHFVPMLIEIGFEQSNAARTASVIGIAVIAGRILIGFAIDKVFAPFVAGFVILAACFSVFLLGYVGAPAAIFAAFVVGFAIGAEVDLIGFLVARYFCLSVYGKVYGVQYAAFLVGAAFSPILVGLVADKFGGYDSAMLVLAALLACSSLVFFLLPKYAQKPNDISISVRP